MKKVLLVATVQSHICQFHKALVQMLRESEDEIEIHVAARDNLDEKNGMQLDFVDKVFDIPFARSPLDKHNIKAFGQLRRIINGGGYDVIHCNTPVGGVLTRIAAGRSRKSGTRVIYTAHGFHFYQGASIKNWMVFYPIEKLLAHRTDILITINEEDYHLAKEKFSCRVEHIHGVGVDESRYYTTDKAQKDEQRKKLGLEGSVMLCVGELLPNKNQSLMLRAMPQIIKKIPNAMLLLAGNGPEREKLEELIRTLGIGAHVRLLGYCTNLEEYQRAVDLSVSCSRREGLGLNLIEGMLSGNPVVATENRGHNELVQNGVNGYLVGNDDVSALADSVIRIFSDRALYAAFAQAGGKIAGRYGYSVVKSELKDIYYGR